MAGSTLVPVGETCSTPSTGWGKLVGSERTSPTSASTPPARVGGPGSPRSPGGENPAGSGPRSPTGPPPPPADAPATTRAGPRGRSGAGSRASVIHGPAYSDRGTCEPIPDRRGRFSRPH